MCTNLGEEGIITVTQMREHSDIGFSDEREILNDI